jgi:hypothetical protein
LNNAGSIIYTYLISPLELSGDNITSTPTQHIVYIAELPYRKENESIIINDLFGISQNQNINGITLHQLSRKPTTQHYADYYQKMTTYVNILTESVSHIDSTVNARK